MENSSNLLLNRRQSSKSLVRTRNPCHGETSAEQLITLVSKGPMGNLLMKRKSEVVCEDRIMPLISSPFGPKTKSRIIPAKQFDNSSLDLDNLLDYTIWSDLGRGSYAVVKLATHKFSGKKFAIKIYENSKLSDPMRSKSTKREIKILKKLNHPNTISLISEEPKEKNLYLVMDYVQGFSLQALITKQTNKRLPEIEAVGVFTQFMRGLEYCHSLLVAHRDIKLENVLIGLDGVVKIIDFGFATVVKRGIKSFVYCGTPNYMAPEIVRKEEYEALAVDIWASGVLLFLLVTGIFPFGSSKESKVFKRILNHDLIFPEYLSGLCKDLINKMLDPNPETRIKAGQVLIHPWIVMKGKVIYKNIQSVGDNEDVVIEEDL